MKFSSLKKIALLLLFVVTLNSCCDCIEGDPENMLITLEEAKEMRLLYKESQHQYINNALDSLFPGTSPDYSDVTFRLEDLEKYMAKVRRETKDMDYDNIGIRFYFGAKLVEETPKSTMFFGPVAIKDTIIPNLENWPQVPGAYGNMGGSGNSPGPK